MWPLYQSTHSTYVLPVTWLHDHGNTTTVDYEAKTITSTMSVTIIVFIVIVISLAMERGVQRTKESLIWTPYAKVRRVQESCW